MHASPALRMFASRPMRMRASPQFKLQPSFRNMKANPDEEHRAHTISQRLRTLKRVPPELIPLGIVLGVAIGAAVYSMGRKFFVDKQLRLTRSVKGDR